MPENRINARVHMADCCERKDKWSGHDVQRLVYARQGVSEQHKGQWVTAKAKPFRTQHTGLPKVPGPKRGKQKS